MRGKTGKRSKNWYIFGLLSILLIIGMGGMAVYAVLENGNSSSLRSVNMEDSKIEMSTLAIGSHLIHLSVLTDELYELAMESANEFNQNQTYYKSELADGTWYEISEASSIADITTSGTPVDKSVIESLEFTHQTGSDGITIDLRTGEAVSIFDIPDPYDLEGMEELEPLLIQYQVLQNKTELTDSDEEYISMIEDFFGKEIENDATKECDETLAALENYKNGFTSREKPAMWREKAETIMASVDAQRRIISLKKVVRYLDILDFQATGIPPVEDEEDTESDEEETEGDEEQTEGDGEESEGEGEEVEVNPELEVNSEIITAIGQCIQNVEESIVAYQTKLLTDEGSTASAQMEYRYSQLLISRVKEEDIEGCDEIMQKLCDLQNIMDGNIANQSSELDALTAELINAAYQIYAKDLSAGVSTEYRTAEAEGSTRAVLAQYLTRQKAQANADRIEYQTMLDAAFQRMESEAAKAYVLKLIDGVPAMRQTIRTDAAQSYLEETLDEHLEWLRSSYATLVKNGSNSTRMEQLEQEKQKLEAQRRDALDNNDLAEANRLKAEMDAIQKEIDQLLASLIDILNSINSSEADKARARAEMGSTNTASLLTDMASDLSSAIRSSDAEGEDLKNQLAALSAAAQLNPDAGKAALDQVGDALNKATGLNSGLVADLKDTLEEAKDAVDAKAQQGAELSKTALASLMDSIMERLFGTDFEHSTSAQQASAILAMEWYGQEENSDTALKFAAALAKQAAANRNPFLYKKYTAKEAYMSLQALGKALDYRYIFDDKYVTVTLQKGKEYYLFTSSKKQYKIAGEKIKKLKASPELMDTLYVHGEDSEKIFSTKAEYIQEAQYAVVGTPSVETQAKELYERLLEGGA